MINLVQFRQLLHQYPELSGEEKATSERIIDALQELRPTKIIRHIGGYGVAAIFDSKKAGKTILFRADMDALPITEVNNFSYASKYQGVGHKCGHDGHSTILLGLAQKLARNPMKKGKVILLFQPAEETGQGAKAVLADPKFIDLQPHFAFALHNVPGYPKGQIVYRKGAFNPAVISLIIRFKGLKTHAAEQENGINPDLTIAILMLGIKGLAENDLTSIDFCNITTIHSRLGTEDYGTAAGEGELHYTIRCWTKEKLAAIKAQIIDLVETECQENSLTFSFEWLHYFAATANADEAVEYVVEAAEKLQIDLYEKPQPFKWGRRFWFIYRIYIGSYVWFRRWEKYACATSTRL